MAKYKDEDYLMSDDLKMKLSVKDYDLYELVMHKKLTAKMANFLMKYRENPTNNTKIYRAIGISPTTFYNVFKKDELFLQEMVNAREKLLDDVEDLFMTTMKRTKSEKLMIKFLESQGKSRGWGKDEVKVEQHIELDGIVTVNINKDKGTLNEDELLEHYENLKGNKNG